MTLSKNPTETYAKAYADVKKPILGLKPRWLHDEERINEIMEAFARYARDKKIIPVEWLEEYNDIAKRYK